jgi:hypothetical protein
MGECGVGMEKFGMEVEIARQKMKGDWPAAAKK